MKFLTEDWLAEFKPILLDAFSPEKTPTKLTLSLCEQYTAVPQCGGQDVWIMYVFENGVLTSITNGIGTDTAPAADYTSFSDYETTKKILLGELGIPRALMSGKVKFKGNVTKALKMLEPYAIVQDTKQLGGKTEW